MQTRLPICKHSDMVPRETGERFDPQCGDDETLALSDRQQKIQQERIKRKSADLFRNLPIFLFRTPNGIRTRVFTVKG
jgi:hypothetical protein